MPAALLLLYAALLLLRVPTLLYPGRFWAEEATVYFYDAYTRNPIDSLLTPHLGYYSLYNKLSCLAATLVPLEQAPVVTAFAALFGQLVPAIVLMTSRFPALATAPSRLAALLLLLFVQPNQEVWLNTANTQFFLCITAALILISEPPCRVSHGFRLVALAVSGLTGVVSCLILPAFAAEYFFTRKSERLHECLVLFAACAAQLGVVMMSPPRAAEWNLSALPYALLIKQGVLPLAGHGVANRAGEFVINHDWLHFPAAVVALLPHFALFAALLRWGRRESIYLLVCSVFIAGLSFLNSVEAASAATRLDHLTAVGGGRYYFAPNAMLALALLISATSPAPISAVDTVNPLRHGFFFRNASRPFRYMAALTVAVILFIGARDFFNSRTAHSWFFSGADWQSEVGAWRRGEKVRLEVYPNGWSVALPPPPEPPVSPRPAQE